MSNLFRKNKAPKITIKLMKKRKLLQLHKSIYEITAQHTIIIFLSWTIIINATTWEDSLCSNTKIIASQDIYRLSEYLRSKTWTQTTLKNHKGDKHCLKKFLWILETNASQYKWTVSSAISFYFHKEDKNKTMRAYRASRAWWAYQW